MKKFLSIAVALVLLIGLIPIAGMMNATAEPKTYTFSEYTAGTQYAANEVHQMDDITVTVDAGHFTTQLRLYDSASNDSTAIIAVGRVITSLSLNIGYKKATLNVYGSTNGSTWTLIQAVETTTTSYADYSVTIPSGSVYTYLKLDAVGAQLRIASITMETTEAGDTDVSDDTTTSTSASTAETTTTTAAPSIDGIVFELGDSGTAAHSDGTEFTAAKDFTSTDGAHTLTITPTAKMYSGALDALGNSCLKLGTSSKAGTFTLTVPDDVTAVVFYVGGYKATAAKIEVNGSAHTISKLSNNGEYEEISVDTTSEKTVTFTTVSGGYRCMINTIAWLTGGATIATTTTTAPTIYQTPAEIMEAAYALADGTYLSNAYTYTLTGVITNVNTAHNGSYATVTMTVDGTDKSIQCYKLTGTGADVIGTGDTITVSGAIKNYHGTIEFDGCQLISYEDSGQEVTIYDGAAAIMDAAYALETGSTLSDGHAYTLTGVITKVNTAHNGTYATVTMTVDGTDKSIQCYKLAGTGADIVAVGDTITVTGPIKNYSGTVEFDGCTLDSYVQAAPEFTGRDVTLGDDLDVGFYVNVPSSCDASTLKVTFTVDGNQKEAALESDGSDGYVVHLEVPAKNMTTAIAASVVDADGNVLSSLSTTVAEYAAVILEGAGYTEVQKTAAKAMINYGAMAQVYFGYNTGALANAGYVSDLTAADVSGVAALSITGDSSNYIGASLVLKSKTVVRLYFSEQVEGSAYNENGWYIELTGIDAGSLAQTQTVTVGETTYSFSALSFAKTVIEGEYSENFQNLMKALVLYSDAASAL